MSRRPLVRILPAAAAVLAAALAAPAAAADLYWRAGAGLAEAGDAFVTDRDCTSETPPALFACGLGGDQRPKGARGDFGESELFELAAGVELTPRWRVELAVASRPDLDLDANANFFFVSNVQPVAAELESTSALVVAALDVAPAGWRLRPFLAAGVGAARNEIGPVTYSFPAIGPTSVTIVQGGSHTDLAWTAGAGLAWRLGDATHVDLAVRHVDLGDVVTDAGPATIVRPVSTGVIDIAGTRADLETTEAVVSLRRRF